MKRDRRKYIFPELKIKEGFPPPLDSILLSTQVCFGIDASMNQHLGLVTDSVG